MLTVQNRTATELSCFVRVMFAVGRRGNVLGTHERLYLYKKQVISSCISGKWCAVFVYAAVFLCGLCSWRESKASSHHQTRHGRSFIPSYPVPEMLVASERNLFSLRPAENTFVFLSRTTVMSYQNRPTVVRSQRDKYKYSANITVTFDSYVKEWAYLMSSTVIILLKTAYDSRRILLRQIRLLWSQLTT